MTVAELIERLQTFGMHKEVVLHGKGFRHHDPILQVRRDVITERDLVGRKSDDPLKQVKVVVLDFE